MLDFKRVSIVAFLKAATALSSFFFAYIVANQYPIEEAGFFLQSYSVFIFCVLALQFGSDTFILRACGAQGIQKSTFEDSLKLALMTLTVNLSLLIIYLVFYNYFISTEMKQQDKFKILFWFLLSWPLASSSVFISMIFQGLKRNFFSSIYYSLGYTTLFILSLTTIQSTNFIKNDIVTLSVVFFICVLIFFIFSVYHYLKIFKNHISINFINNKINYISLLNLWAVSLGQMFITWGSIIISGFYLNDTSLALLNTAQRVGWVMSLTLLVINMVYAPVFSKYWFQKDMRKIESLARVSFYLLALIGFPMFIVAQTYPEEIMKLFGEEYADAATLLRIISFGQFINILTGSVAVILNMTGNERALKNIALFCSILVILTSVLLIPAYGVSGAAWSITIGLATYNIGALLMVRKKLGFWIFR